MKANTKKHVKHLLKEFAISTLREDYDIEQIKRSRPFHVLFFDDAGLIASVRERSIVTKMGKNLYPQLAKVIAVDQYKDVILEKLFIGRLDGNVDTTINRIVSDLRNGKRQPDHDKEVQEIINASGGGLREVKVIADLYIGDFGDGPLFAEIKSPKPNLDVAAESKLKILRFLALYQGKNPNAYLAFAYNPYVTRKKYKHAFTKRIMDLEKEVLMGEEFWDKIGGERTFNELLELIDGVGEEIQELFEKYNPPHQTSFL